jgi:hypothetical protein
MRFFSNKPKNEWVIVTKYYKIDGDIYQFTLHEAIDKKDNKLSTAELFNKYGFCVSRYNLKYNCFTDWNETYYDSLDEVYGMNNAEPIDIENLEKAIQNIKKDIKKKFEDFDLEEDKLYTRNTRVGAIGEQCFNTIVKPISKLVDEKNKGITSLILEVDVLDGKNSLTRREFMTFIDFVENYSEGCNLKILETVDDLGSVNDYFVW